MAAGEFIVRDVSLYITKNYTDETVFSHSRDFGATIELRTSHFIKRNAAVNHIMRQKQYIEVTSEEVVLNRCWREKISLLCYHRFNPQTRESSLQKVRDS